MSVPVVIQIKCSQCFVLIEPSHQHLNRVVIEQVRLQREPVEGLGDHQQLGQGRHVGKFHAKRGFDIVHALVVCPGVYKKAGTQKKR